MLRKKLRLASDKADNEESNCNILTERVSAGVLQVREPSTPKEEAQSVAAKTKKARPFDAPLNVGLHRPQIGICCQVNLIDR
jgi:hypothetical protein